MDQKCRKEVREALSVSDEAFALVVLENNWNILTSTGENKAEPLYTFSRRGYANDDGWGGRGLARFNELYEMVNMNRLTKRKIDVRVRDKLFQEYYEAKMAVEKKRKREEQQRIEHELAVWRAAKRQAACETIKAGFGAM